MQDEELLAEALIKFGKMFCKASVIIDGFVIDVDETNYSCTVNVPLNSNGKTIDNIYYKVPLKILQGSQASFVEIPKVTTHCLICFKDNNIQRPQLYGVDICDKILVKIGDSIFYVDSDGFTFSNGSYGLKKTLSDLCNELINAIVLTGSGPANFNPDTILKFQQILTDLDKYLK